jgi:hypothetical protein
MGKLTEHTKDLPAHDPHEYQRAQINELKAKIKEEAGPSASSAYFAHQYCELRDQVAELEAELKAAQRQLDAVIEVMDERMDAEGTTFLRLDTGRSVGVYTEPFAVVEDKEAVRQWWHDQGLDSKLVIHSGTLNSLAKARLEDGEPSIPGVKLLRKLKVRMG